MFKQLKSKYHSSDASNNIDEKLTYIVLFYYLRIVEIKLSSQQL